MGLEMHPVIAKKTQKKKLEYDLVLHEVACQIGKSAYESDKAI